ncbi:MAG TPA: cytochrome B [Saprospiraceae bacterium]|jgi:hypothetical protein|nr:cytochrome B [Saprospiraceae bacterium]MCC6689459.1 cytochrome b [Saprospiraceae bacterium]HMV24267.1 cytochrome B [Saprospiraceae bacterium]HMX82664.1 cytochrome B [Saprospiraceae bacterium]HMX84954.1 cytochrome B [Saprospiraceae bacterium]
MYTGMMHLHSTLRYVLLILLIVTIYKAYTGYKQGRAFAAGDDKLSLYTMIVTHLQLLIGLYMYFASPTVQNALTDMKTAMADKVLRFLAVEHILGMLIGIALITVGRIASKKKSTGTQKFKTIWLYYGLGLLVIFLSIPWPFRGLGYGWF